MKTLLMITFGLFIMKIPTLKAASLDIKLTDPINNINAGYTIESVGKVYTVYEYRTDAEKAPRGPVLVLPSTPTVSSYSSMEGDIGPIAFNYQSSKNYAPGIFTVLTVYPKLSELNNGNGIVTLPGGNACKVGIKLGSDTFNAQLALYRLNGQLDQNLVPYGCFPKLIIGMKSGPTIERSISFDIGPSFNAIGASLQLFNGSNVTEVVGGDAKIDGATYIVAPSTMIVEALERLIVNYIKAMNDRESDLKNSSDLQKQDIFLADIKRLRHLTAFARPSVNQSSIDDEIKPFLNKHFKELSSLNLIFEVMSAFPNYAEPLSITDYHQAVMPELKRAAIALDYYNGLEQLKKDDNVSKIVQRGGITYNISPNAVQTSIIQMKQDISLLIVKQILQRALCSTKDTERTKFGTYIEGYDDSAFRSEAYRSMATIVNGIGGYFDYQGTYINNKAPPNVNCGRVGGLRADFLLSVPPSSELIDKDTPLYAKVAYLSFMLAAVKAYPFTYGKDGSLGVTYFGQVNGYDKFLPEMNDEKKLEKKSFYQFLVGVVGAPKDQSSNDYISLGTQAKLHRIVLQESGLMKSSGFSALLSGEMEYSAFTQEINSSVTTLKRVVKDTVTHYDFPGHDPYIRSVFGHLFGPNYLAQYLLDRFEGLFVGSYVFVNSDGTGADSSFGIFVDECKKKGMRLVRGSDLGLIINLNSQPNTPLLRMCQKYILASFVPDTGGTWFFSLPDRLNIELEISNSVKPRRTYGGFCIRGGLSPEAESVGFGNNPATGHITEYGP